MIYFKTKWKAFFLLKVFTTIMLIFLVEPVSAQSQPTVQVFVQITSGMPNPEWTINSLNEVAQLQKFIEGLPTSTPVETPPFGAFLLMSDESISGFPQTVLVSNGVITVIKANRTPQFFRDTKGLRKFLVTEAKKRSINIGE